MEQKIKITKLADAELRAKQKEIAPKIKRLEKKGDDQLNLAALRSQLAEIEEILGNAEVIEFSEKEPAIVVLGARVTLENLDTADKREYTILTRSTANPLKGVLSNESPLGQKMMGLKLGNTFKFKEIGGKEESYKIKTIE